MWTKEDKPKRKNLSREIFLLLVMDVLFSTFVYFFLRSQVGSFAYDYCEKNQIVLDELQSITLQALVANASLLGALLVFITVFLLLAGNKLSYIKELTAGIHELRTHRMEHEIPLKGNNELTELAESINYLAETERQLKAVQRNLSHDIRTPLTAILSYTEYMQGKESLSEQELAEFLELTRRKAEQIKMLTEQLLDGGSRLTTVEDGRLLMHQLAEEWEESLEGDFICQIHLDDCPAFSRQLDIEELRRIFDNLASNIKKYADRKDSISLHIGQENGRITIEQSNRKSTEGRITESRKIGLTSIETIAKHYGGCTKVKETETHFAITISLFEV